ncbi:hypothetical protein LPJ78_001892 [Coemansia sp. RSA 989]|nr:hypothetical protein LPJ78_001892 [Coemansia sp. RSA 989]KAJ1873748.1 hypothetical protein LPJ55_002087 [Coemansia sp. RSA 990]KAJ2653913.1 hypothetical protein IWW40_000197 [Coemansia sp. RSA 1250]KAJ2677063.1 hypothetical protein IWW42_000401 [Coemansia sp. RSA 1085]
MTLFGDLPPPKGSESAPNDVQEPLPDAEKTRSWSRPELVPNLRRPKPTSKQRSTKPKDALALASRWEEAALTAEEPSSSQPPLPKRPMLNSLAEYLPASSKKNSNYFPKMSESVAAKIIETASSVMATVAPGYVDIFDQYGVIRPEFDDRTESEMSPADMFFLTMSLFLVGGCVSIVGGYYLNRALRSNKDKASIKAAEKKAAEKAKNN